MSFSQVKSRVLGCLSKRQIVHLESEVSKRIASQPLTYLDGASLTDSDRFKVFKQSLISIYPKRKEDAEYNSALHLIRTFMDCFRTSKVSRSDDGTSYELNSNEPVKSDLKQKSKPKPKVSKPKVKKPKCLEPDVSSLETTSDEVEISTESIQQMDCVSYTPSIPATVPESEIVDVEPTELVKSKKKRSRNKRSDGSATPGNPSNKRVACEQLLEEPRSDTPEVNDEDVWNVHWSRLAGLVHAQDIPRMLACSPNVFGISCRAEKLSKCSNCIATILSCPFTFCKTVQCKNTSHPSMGLHHMSDLNLQQFHDGGQKEFYHMIQSMYQKDMLPSFMYVMLHDKVVKKAKPDGNCTHALRKCIDLYLH